MSKRTIGILSECIPIFTMLQNESRQQILMLLFEHKEMTVSEMTESLELSRPAVSHHMKLLLDAGLSSVWKNGKERIYRLNLQKVLEQLKELLLSIETDIKYDA